MNQELNDVLVRTIVITMFGVIGVLILCLGSV